MQTSRRQHHGTETILALMNDWPESWAGDNKDVPVGRALVELLRPFIVDLLAQGLARKTLRRHLNNLWAIGGEIIREINGDPKLRRRSPKQLILDAIAGGEAPLVQDATDAEQRLLDSTAKNLLKFLSTQDDPTPR